MNTSDNSASPYTAQDLISDQEVRWCPSCGDFSILKQLQITLPKLGIPREKLVFVSGIGCSSRLPYYMNTFGVHTIHGRGPTFATGLKLARPDLNIWLITGDGDGLSIGGNHLIHLLRRNIDMQVLLFNNRIYGLTKGQFSPVSEIGKITKSSPAGTTDPPFQTALLALGAGCTFFARTMDKEAKHMQQTFEQAATHSGTSLIEIYQNCNVFNDNAFLHLSDKVQQKENALFLQEGLPLVFGQPGNEKVLLLKNTEVEVGELSEYKTHPDVWIHEPENRTKAILLAQFDQNSVFPVPFGVIFRSTMQTISDVNTTSVDFNNSQEAINNLLEGENAWLITEK